MSTGIYDWRKCIFCQKGRKGTKKETTRSTPEGLDGASKLITEFIERNINTEFVARISKELEQENHQSVLDLFQVKNACYHHSCVLEQRHTLGKTHADSERTDSAVRTSKRRSGDLLGELTCLFCSKGETEEKLSEAGIKYATKKKVNISHANETAIKWRDMALALGKTEISSALSVGDLASNEIFYHRTCLTEFHNDFKVLTVSKSDLDESKQRKAWCESSALYKVIDFIYEKDREEPGSSFSVKSLEEQYMNLLTHQGIKYTSHVTRFADKLVDNVDGLIKDTTQKKIIVYLQKNVSSMMYHSCDSPNILMSKFRDVATQIRNTMSTHKNEFVGCFNKNSQADSIPMALITFVSMLVDGTTTENNVCSQGALTAAQVIMYNFRKKFMKTSTGNRRHSKSHETPLVIYSSLKLYSETRSKNAIDDLHALGIGVSYQRVLDITKNLYDSQRNQYERDGVLVPCVMRKNVFTILAKDNIDLNARSTDAKSHYHGTSLSGLQYPNEENPGSVLQRTYEDLPNVSKKLDNLPKEYCEVPELPSNPRKGITAPVCTVNLPTYFETLSSLMKSMQLEYEWLTSFDNENGFGWAKHHSSFNRSGTDINVGVNAILPLINKQVHRLDTMYHVMNLNTKITNFLNSSQTPVDTCDQPVYALTKTIQWMFPETFGSDKYLSILGGLHIEQSALVMHGELIKGSGLEKVLAANDLSIVGTSAVVDVNDIKRARYCLQVAACAVFRKLKDAYLQSGSASPILDWLELRSKESEMCFYWKLILDFQVLVLVFVRSIREGNFQVYIESLIALCKWYFALDHIHYSRWCTVQCFDLMLLEVVCPDVYKEFLEGNFSFQKTNSQFSRLATDQIHEQNNKIIKGAGGAKHLLNKVDESGLIRWETIGTDIARILSEFEDTINQPTHVRVKNHHEDNNTFQTTFSGDVQKVYDGIVTNPFLLDTLTSLSNTSLAFPDNVFHNISILKSTGEKQFLRFFNDRLILGKETIDSKLTKNQFVLPGHVDPSEKKSEKSKSMIIKDSQLTKLRSALDHREMEAKKIFSQELLGVSHSIALTPTSLYHAKKSAITDRLATVPYPSFSDTTCSAIIIELSAMTIIKAKCNAETFYDFALILYQYIMVQARNFKRIDIVCDQYFSGSLKEGTRRGRGHGTRKIFDDDTKFPEKMRDDFLKHSENKECLNRYLADKFIEFHSTNSSKQHLSITYGDTIKSTEQELLDSARINFCTSEEADARLVRHAINCVETGYDPVVVRTVDTDVLVLMISYYPFMSDINNGTRVLTLMGNNWSSIKVYDINALASEIGYSVCKGLPFFYAFTGCDTVSSMYHCSKTNFWDELFKQPNIPQLLSVFAELSTQPIEVTSEQVDILEIFLVRVYYPKKVNTGSLSDERAAHFKRLASVNIRQLPLSRPGLIEHTKRACIQGGWLWGECVANMQIPPVTEWGWQRAGTGHGNEQGYVPQWQTVDESFNIDHITKTCTCRKATCKSCKCAKSGLACLPFCGCEKSCEN